MLDHKMDKIGNSLQEDEQEDEQRDERGATLQTVILISIFILAALGFSIILYNIFIRQEDDLPGNRIGETAAAYSLF